MSASFPVPLVIKRWIQSGIPSPGIQLYRIVCSQGEMALLGNDGWWAGISVAGGRAREEELYRIHYVNYRRTIDY